jgi:restriction system protein
MMKARPVTRTTPAPGPQFTGYFWPVIEALGQLGGSARPAEVRERVAKNLGVSEAVQTEVTSNGRARFDNRVAWARFYLAKADLIDASRRGVWSLTEKGRSLRTLTPTDAVDLFKKVAARFRAGKPEEIDEVDAETERDAPPEEAASTITGDHRQQILELLRSLPPSGFERFCQRLLRESGFQHVTVTGKSNDGGIDGIGILQVNALVSFKVLFQCKKYAGTVNPSQVRDFRGAMMGRADKGIILTTGSFTSEAQREALRDGVPPIELVDGERLVGMLEELELGLSPTKAYRIDSDFFRDFQS